MVCVVVMWLWGYAQYMYGAHTQGGVQRDEESTETFAFFKKKNSGTKTG